MCEGSVGGIHTAPPVDRCISVFQFVPIGTIVITCGVPTLYCMELEEPTEAVCPLCEDEIVDIKLNSSDREAPYFTCRTHQTTVPGMYGGDQSEEFVREYIELAQTREEEPEQNDDESETKTLADILGENNE